MNKSLTLRPVTEQDTHFLFEVFVDTRPDIAGATHLPEEQRAQLLRSQFNAQHLHYTKHFPKADFGIIQYGNTLIGRLYVNRTADELHIVDIAILSDYRSQGFGSTLVSAVMEEARLTKRLVRIHVDKSNPAIEFYRRLGFVKISDKPLHHEMRWNPGTNPGIITDIS